MKSLVFPLALAALASGCASRVPFTHQMRTDLNLEPATLKRIQYYVSEPIVLQRELDRHETRVTSGHKLKIYHDHRLEEVVIRKGAPGVAVDAGTNTLAISFEDGKSLLFSSDAKNRNQWEGKYVLAAQEWKGEQGKLQYNGETFWSTPTSGFAYLLVDIRELGKFRKESRKVRGRKLR